MSGKFSFKKNTNCRICNNDILKTYLDLGDQPPSNSFIKKDELYNEEFFSLKIQLCESCGLSQLDTIVAPSDIFDDYMYLSSTSKALVNHYKEMTKKIVKLFDPQNNDLIVDIGSNDGITLDTYEKNKFKLLGIEPSSAAKISSKKGIDTENSFFTYDFSEKLVSKYGYAKIITTTNVFAHIEDIRNFTKGIKKFLDQQGVFVIEFPYLRNMLEDKLFDIIYHEHLSYLSILPLCKLFSDFELKIFDIEKVDIGASGPALRIFVSHLKSNYHVQNTVNDFVDYEEKHQFKSLSTYENFAKEVFKIRDNIENLILDLSNDKKKIGAFGAPAKGNTMLNFLKKSNSKIIAVADNTPTKIGKLTPGTHIPIVSDDEFNKMQIDYALLLSWNYVDFFIKNTEYIKNNGKFIVPLPQLKLCPNE